MTLFAALAALAPSAAQVAALLGITRQAYGQAIKRGRLSAAVALRASALLGLDPGAALADNYTAPAPVPRPAAQPANNAQGIQIMRNHDGKKNDRHQQHRRQNSGTMKNAHVIDLQNDPTTETALDVVRWCLAVAHLRPDSPRFAYYVSRWNVPDKIARAKAAGTFDALTSDAGPLDPSWLRFVPAALAEWRSIWHIKDSDATPASCHNITTDKQLSPAA